MVVIQEEVIGYLNLDNGSLDGEKSVNLKDIRGGINRILGDWMWKVRKREESRMKLSFFLAE